MKGVFQVRYFKFITKIKLKLLKSKKIIKMDILYNLTLKKLN